MNCQKRLIKEWNSLWCSFAKYFDILVVFLQIEVKVICELTSRQKWLYRAIRNKISIEDLVQTSTSTSTSSSATNNLMNIVMQFRKVGYKYVQSVVARFITQPGLLCTSIAQCLALLQSLVFCVTAQSGLQYYCIVWSLIATLSGHFQVCNHPELFERHEVTSPLNLSLKPYPLPKLMFREGMTSCIAFQMCFSPSCDCVCCLFLVGLLCFNNPLKSK